MKAQPCSLSLWDSLHIDACNPLGLLPSSEFAGSEARISILTSPVYYLPLSVSLIKYSTFLSCIYLIFNSSSCLPPLPSSPAFLTHTPWTVPRVNNFLILMFSHINPMKWIGNHFKSSRDILVHLRKWELNQEGVPPTSWAICPTKMPEAINWEAQYITVT